MRSILIVIIFLILPITLIHAYHQTIVRHTIPAFNDDNCIRALIGEYATSDNKGMKLMAHAIRNRGTLKGVYGFNAPHVDRENKNTWIDATFAWLESANEVDPLDGANEWRSIADIERHGAPKGFTFVKFYDGIYYYKPTAKTRSNK